MTVEQVRAEVQRLRTLTRDPEAFHAEEDKLHRRVLEQLASEGRSLAAAALETLNIDCPRWIA